MPVVLGAAAVVIAAIIAATSALAVERYRRRNQVADTSAMTQRQETVAEKELRIEEARFLVEQWQRLHGEQAEEIKGLRGDVDNARAQASDALEKHARCESELGGVRHELGIIKRQMRDASRSLSDDGIVGDDNTPPPG